MDRPLRLAVLNSHPIQYFAPLYAFLNRDPGLEVTALYCSDASLRGSVDPGFGQTVSWDVDLLSGYRAVFLGSKARMRTPKGFYSLICPELLREMSRGQYDAICLHGYSYAAYVLALLVAKACGLAVLMRSETHLGLKRSGWKQRLRDRLLSIAYRYVDAFLAIGKANHEYYRALGVPEEKIFDVPYTVDNDRFIKAVKACEGRHAEIRRKYGLALDKPIVLYASKFVRRKHPEILVKAMAQLKNDSLTATLLMVGAGEMEQELRTLAASLGMKDVVFAGFVNQSELPEIYAASTLFVLPSENEPWGLIVNEVMCAGLPVIVSEEVGCVPDLVKDGVNGYQIKAGDVDSLRAALAKLLSDESRRHRMGAASLAIIREWSYERCRQGITAALRRCIHD